MASYEAEQARLLRLMEEVELSEMEYDGLESKEEDSLEKRETDSESEQEISDIEDVEVQGREKGKISDHKVAGNEPTFIGKNKITQWSKVVPKKSIRIRAENKMTPEEWTILKELCQVLKPFEVSGENYISASLVIVLNRGLLDVCDKLSKEDYSASIKQVIAILGSGLRRRLGNVEYIKP
ncbi:hypothetical protein JTB14_027432 [Gonioctena quinquepunctata]|nr:hypothetical protein JTB14_027432 [Gonioctena quinquepunctata]